MPPLAGLPPVAAQNGAFGAPSAVRTAGLAARAVPEWQAVLGALRKLDDIGAGTPAGFWGVSLGRRSGAGGGG